VGSLGAYGCFSFFPSKNLGGFGDGGLVTTQDAVLADKARVMRAHGSQPKYYHSVIGGNFRIDALQAALLRVKLPELESWTARRRVNASRYDAAFSASGLDQSLLRPPPRRFDGHIYNQYVVRTSRRDELQAHLQSERIATAIYYPVPLGPGAADLCWPRASPSEACHRHRNWLLEPIEVAIVAPAP
jgi:dTDP-4-amino-4,6-dideoxygalactose transaminase